MEHPAKPNPPITLTANPLKQTLGILQAVIIVAIVLATLFTAWTDPGLLPGNVGKNFTVQQIARATLSADIQTTPTLRSRPLIGIVAGHSGHDSGAVCPDGLTEVSINQQIAAYIQKLLMGKNIDVDILQEFDERLDGYQALAVISIHADSCDFINDQATGFKVAAALSNPHPERAARLTACMRARYSQATGLSLHNSITNDMTGYHAFDEINSETTAMIIEVGFMNLDKQLLTQKPVIVAQGIADGVLCFINNENVNP